MNEENDIDEVIRKVDRLQDKAKFMAFDKTKIKRGKHAKLITMSLETVLKRRKS